MDTQQFDIERFEQAAKENGVKYWFAHEFMLELGYQNWETFKNVVIKAMGICSRLEIDATEEFISDQFIENGKEKKTFRLTRFACLLVAMQADSRKDKVAKVQAALASFADSLIKQTIEQNDIQRVEKRGELRDAEKTMEHAAQEAGLRSNEYGIFKDAGYRGMYNMSLKELKQYKGVNPSAVLYDYMGVEEMAGNWFRVTQTRAKIKADNAKGLNQLKQTAKQVGSEVRQMMVRNSGGQSPEDLPIEEKVSKVETRIKNTQKKMSKADEKKPKKKK